MKKGTRQNTKQFEELKKVSDQFGNRLELFFNRELRFLDAALKTQRNIQGSIRNFYDEVIEFMPEVGSLSEFVRQKLQDKFNALIATYHLEDNEFLAKINFFSEPYVSLRSSGKINETVLAEVRLAALEKEKRLSAASALVPSGLVREESKRKTVAEEAEVSGGLAREESKRKTVVEEEEGPVYENIIDPYTYLSLSDEEDAASPSPPLLPRGARPNSALGFHDYTHTKTHFNMESATALSSRSTLAFVHRDPERGHFGRPHHKGHHGLHGGHVDRS